MLAHAEKSSRPNDHEGCRVVARKNHIIYIANFLIVVVIDSFTNYIFLGAPALLCGTYFLLADAKGLGIRRMNMCAWLYEKVRTAATPSVVTLLVNVLFNKSCINPIFLLLLFCK